MTVADVEAAEIVDRVRQASALARRARPGQVCETWYLFAGHCVHLRVVGRDLAAHLQQPFSHLAIANQPDAAADLTIDLWDERETGVPCPSGLTDTLDLPIRTAGGALTYSDDGRLAQYLRPASSTWLVRDAGQIIGWRAAGKLLSFFERRRPLPVLLALWYYDRGIYCTHASLAARADRGVLLPGVSGAGKSTSVLACLAAGFDFLGDDEIGVQRLLDGSFVGHSICNSVHLERHQLSHFPQLQPFALASDEPGEVKALLLLSQIVPERLKQQVPIRAIALPRLVDAVRSQIRPAPRGEALRTIGTSTLLKSPLGLGAPGLKQLAYLVKEVPCFWLELGRDLATIPPCLDDVLSLTA
jgi:hypothetical protein